MTEAWGRGSRGRGQQDTADAPRAQAGLWPICDNAPTSGVIGRDALGGSRLAMKRPRRPASSSIEAMRSRRSSGGSLSPSCLRLVIAAVMEAGEGWTVAQRGLDQEPDTETEVYLPDSAAEYGVWYRLAPVCYMGGSLLGEGCARSPMEAAAVAAVTPGTIDTFSPGASFCATSRTMLAMP